MTLKRNDDQIRCDVSSRIDIMKFIWLVKNKITLFENCMILSTGHINLSFIYTDKFPEIMRFSLKTEITHIFKIVNTEYSP